MTAGKGIAHSERFEDPAIFAAGELEMIQTWVVLPEKDEVADPSFKNYTAEELPVFTDKGVWMRLIAGDAYGLASHVKTSSPLFYLHGVLQEGARFGLPTGHNERGAYIVKGSAEVNGITYTDGKLFVFTKGADPPIIAKENTTLRFRVANTCEIGISGGTLYPAVKNGLRRLRKIGNRAVFFCLPQIMKNLFRCLKTIPSLLEGLLPELFPDKSKYVHWPEKNQRIYAIIIQLCKMNRTTVKDCVPQSRMRFQLLEANGNWCC